MAVSNKLGFYDLAGLDSEMAKLISKAKWLPIDCQPNYDYQTKVDDGQKRPLTGTTILLLGPRTGDKRIRNKELQIKLSEDSIWDYEECKAFKSYIDENAPEYHLQVTKATAYAILDKQTKRLNTGVSIYGRLINDDGEIVNYNGNPVVDIERKDED